MPDRREPVAIPIPVVVKQETPVEVSLSDDTLHKQVELHEQIKQPIVGGFPLQSQLRDPSLPAKTTFQQDLTFAGQRQINLIWERTQAAIAIVVVLSTMAAGLYGMMYSKDQIPTIISMAFGTVVGFYFSRTNHAAIGGLGNKAEAPYEGR